jgi:multidrug resistance efflux pump
VRTGTRTAAGAALLLTLLTSCDSNRASQHAGRLLEVRPGPLEVRLTEYGEVVAREVRSVTAPFSGEIIWVAAEGAHLKPGDPVVRMNTEDLESQLEEDRNTGVGLKSELQKCEALATAIARSRKASVKIAETRLEIARQRLVEASRHPTDREKRSADLVLRAARLRLDRARAEERSLRELAEQGFISKARAKAASLALVRARAEMAQASAAHREALAGLPPETIRAHQVAVKKAELSLSQARFNAEADLITARDDLAVAKARHQVFLERLERTKSRIASAEVGAPIDGVVALVDVWKGGGELSPVQVGENHRQGRELLKMADISALRIKVQVNERDIVQMEPGSQARVRLTAYPGLVYSARVAEIAAFADDKNRQLGSLAMEKSGLAGVNVVEVLLDLEAPRSAAAPRLGSSALVEIVTSRLESALAVPLAAVEWDGDRSYVRVMRAGVPTRVEVVLGPGNTRQVAVRSGLSAGDRVCLPPGEGEDTDG